MGDDTPRSFRDDSFPIPSEDEIVDLCTQICEADIVAHARDTDCNDPHSLMTSYLGVHKDLDETQIVPKEDIYDCATSVVVSAPIGHSICEESSCRLPGEIDSLLDLPHPSIDSSLGQPLIHCSQKIDSPLVIPQSVIDSPLVLPQSVIDSRIDSRMSSIQSSVDSHWGPTSSKVDSHQDMAPPKIDSRLDLIDHSEFYHRKEIIRIAQPPPRVDSSSTDVKLAVNTGRFPDIMKKKKRLQRSTRIVHRLTSNPTLSRNPRVGRQCPKMRELPTYKNV